MADYTPTMGMVRALARAELGEAAADDFDRDRCMRRGLLTHRGLTHEGQAVLRRAVQQHEAHGG